MEVKSTAAHADKLMASTHQRAIKRVASVQQHVNKGMASTRVLVYAQPAACMHAPACTCKHTSLCMRTSAACSTCMTMLAPAYTVQKVNHPAPL
eukprot:scaffold67908_cov20-Tisochrysis_lutea.AAC.3